MRRVNKRIVSVPSARVHRRRHVGRRDKAPPSALAANPASEPSVARKHAKLSVKAASGRREGWSTLQVTSATLQLRGDDQLGCGLVGVYFPSRDALSWWEEMETFVQTRLC